jgi:hypothetical protein
MDALPLNAADLREEALAVAHLSQIARVLA